MEFQTAQEIFWAVKFGDDYIRRNNLFDLIAGNISFIF